MAVALAYLEMFGRRGMSVCFAAHRSSQGYGVISRNALQS